MGLRRYEPSISTVGEAEDLESLLLMCSVHLSMCLSVTIYRVDYVLLDFANLYIHFFADVLGNPFNNVLK